MDSGRLTGGGSKEFFGREGNREGREESNNGVSESATWSSCCEPGRKTM